MSNTCKAVLADDVHLNQNCQEILVWAELVDCGKDRHRVYGAPSALLFEPDADIVSRAGVLPARCLVDGRSGLVPIRLLNITASKLYKGKTLGTVEAAPEVVSFVSPGFTKSEPPHLLDTNQLDWSNTELTDDELQELCDLLRCYSDVFSTGPGDLGRTNVIRHSIPTQSSHPIRRRQYRQPYHLKKGMDRQIGDMLTNGVIKESSSPCHPQF